MISSNFRSICIIGADGAGKTTVGNEIVDQVQYSDRSYRYWWCGWREFRSFPFRAARKIAHLTGIIGDDRDRDASSTNRSAADPSLFTKVLGLFYFSFVAVDHVLSTVPRAVKFALDDTPVIYDRYYFGMLVGFCAYYSYSKRVVDLLMSFAALYPSPDVVIYLDVPPETAYERKADVPSPEYIVKRRQTYLHVVDEQITATVDAGNSQEQVVADVLEILEEDDA
ncbi:Thymidylate kinase [Halomicrobium zhouii]|uniref:Thymidylate kinase n=1 Tax=Halomicrobium zhouii TaxID=767519 RepID=A0A1I6K8C1_9EURY|nr:hypothetical protein [Halomicrobium zhouii]SFR87481.1 Thymidylate kinase [Halomicrobium zhouii]